MALEVNLTQEEYDKLSEELEYLKTTKRAELAEKIKTARGFGDLSENSEYDEAKNEQGLVEQKIMDMEAKLKNAKIISKSDVERGVAGVGTTVVVVDANGNEKKYDIVGSTGYDPKNGKISEDSPIGAALKGHRTGDTVHVQLPNGKSKQLTIKKVSVKK